MHLQGIEEAVTDKGDHSDAMLVMLKDAALCLDECSATHE